MTEHDNLLSTAEAAGYLGLSRSTLAKGRITGNTCPYIKIGRRVLYRQSVLDAWLNEMTRSSTSEVV